MDSAALVWIYKGAAVEKLKRFTAILTGFLVMCHFC